MPGAGVGDSNHFPTCRLDRLEHCFDADWHCTSSQHREAAGSSSQAGRMTEPSGLAASGYGNQAVTKPPHQPCHRLAARRGDNHGDTYFIICCELPVEHHTSGAVRPVAGGRAARRTAASGRAREGARAGASRDRRDSRGSRVGEQRRNRLATPCALRVTPWVPSVPLVPLPF